MFVGCDVGGTFTDAVAVDEGVGTARAKAPSTPEALEEGAVDAIQAAVEGLGVDAGDVGGVVHGTTVATNALLEGELARVAFVTNEGFGDVLEIGRQARPSLYDMDEVGAPPLVPRELRFEVPGRLDADGSEHAPVEGEAVREVGKGIREAGVDAIAVCLVNAHLSGRHEQRVAEELEGIVDARVVTSHGVSPEVREVERFTTTVVNAGLVPLVEAYLDRLEAKLEDAGFNAPVRVMDSAGGSVKPGEASRLPVRLVLSGPAGGVAAMQRVSRVTGHGDLLGVDMGGTSTDVSLVLEGEGTTRWVTEVAGRRVQVPAADVHTVGAGGGSIAWVDEAGALKVGPKSAGAHPGPAAYGNGGEEATVTDANVVLDRIPGSATLGGRIRLDPDAAFAAVKRVADEAGLGVEATAQAIVRVANASAVRGMRVLVARHGVDPSALTVAPFGGAGPQFGAEWADLLGSKRVLVPRGAGVTSAAGLLAAPARVERSASLLVDLEEATSEELSEAGERLGERAREALGEAGASIGHRVSARYAGQSHEITVPVPALTGQAIRDAFEAAHEARHGYRLEEASIEVVTVRARASTRPVLAPPRDEAPPDGGSPAWVGTVEAWHQEPGERVPTRVAKESALTPGHAFKGPCLVMGAGSTLLVPPAWKARVLQGGHIELQREGAA